MMADFIKMLLDSLPVIQRVKLYTEPDCYGISRMIARNLYLPFTPRSFSYWLHGWLYVDLKYIEQFGVISKQHYLVATKEQEYFLTENGINAKAVGAPYVYVKNFDQLKVTRKKRSLLVMPPHGLPYTTEKWDEEGYVKEICELKSDFDLIVACIHPSCAEKKAWVRQFESYGIQCITGAEMHDKNALVRMHRIFQHFEFMTTNCIGSHVAYAAYSGCKISIYGKFAEFSKDDLKNDVLYLTYPHVMEHNLFSSTKQTVHEKFPFLFVHPSNAVEAISWASDELGEANKLVFYKLASQLGWLPHQQAYHWSIKIYSKLQKEALRLLRK